MEEISRRLSVAIKDKNLRLATQLLDRLANLSRSDLIVQALVETINNETIEYNSDIYTIVIGAIANYMYLPGLRDVWERQKTIERGGSGLSALLVLIPKCVTTKVYFGISLAGSRGFLLERYFWSRDIDMSSG